MFMVVSELHFLLIHLLYLLSLSRVIETYFLFLYQRIARGDKFSVFIINRIVFKVALIFLKKNTSQFAVYIEI